MTYPGTGQPMTAGVLADGSSVNHLDQHGNSVGHAISAKKYLRGDGTTESGAAVLAFEAACAGKEGFVPPGTYVIPDNTRFFQMADNTIIRGAGIATVISTKNEWAFKSPTSGTTNAAQISGFRTILRSGSTTGGGVKVRSVGSYNSNWTVSHMTVEGVTGALDPLVWLDGFITGVLEDTTVSTCGGHGILMDSTGFSCNNWVARRCTVSFAGAADITKAAFRVDGTTNGVNQGYITDNCQVEGNTCRGVHITNGEGITLDNVWFENNWNNDVYIDGTAVKNRVQNCQFSYFATGHGVDANLRHVYLTSSNVALRHNHNVRDNHFLANATPSGIKMEIDTNCVGTVVTGNRGLGSGYVTNSILDNGYYSAIFANEPSTPNIFPVDTNRVGGLGLSLHGANTVLITAGINSPEGIVTAPPGSLYLCTNGGASTSLYVKTSGTGNTGWTAK